MDQACHATTSFEPVFAAERITHERPTGSAQFGPDWRPAVPRRSRSRAADPRAPRELTSAASRGRASRIAISGSASQLIEPRRSVIASRTKPRIASSESTPRNSPYSSAEISKSTCRDRATVTGSRPQPVALLGDCRRTRRSAVAAVAARAIPWTRPRRAQHACQRRTRADARRHRQGSARCGRG